MPDSPPDSPPSPSPVDAETTPALGLPFIVSGQAQKHVTHNEALAALDALVQLAVRSVGANDPPADAAEGERHIVGEAPTGAWEGRAGAVAAMQGGAWAFHAPHPGWIAVHEGAALVRGADGWAPLVGAPERVERLGIGTHASVDNRLAVAAPGTLLTHEGADHRLAINRAGPGDVASVVFQTGFSGRAELGLAGEGAFRIRSSADGTDWVDALTVDPASGAVEMPATVRPACALFPSDHLREHARGERFALSALIDTRGGLAADGLAWVVPQSGLYLIGVSLVPRAKTDTRAGVDVMAGDARLLRCVFNETAGTPSFSAMSMNALVEGAPISFACFTGTAQGTASLWPDTRFLVARLG